MGTVFLPFPLPAEKAINFTVPRSYCFAVIFNHVIVPYYLCCYNSWMLRPRSRLYKRSPILPVKYYKLEWKRRERAQRAQALLRSCVQNRTARDQGRHTDTQGSGASGGVLLPPREVPSRQGMLRAASGAHLRSLAPGCLRSVWQSCACA